LITICSARVRGTKTDVYGKCRTFKVTLGHIAGKDLKVVGIHVGIAAALWLEL